MSVAKGRIGEAQAVTYLESQGYRIIEMNWRFKRAEIDLIATYGDEIIFVEVKKRVNNTFGYPEEYVTHAKARHLRRAIEGYLVIHGAQVARLQPRVDIIAITDTPFEIRHIQNIEL